MHSPSLPFRRRRLPHLLLTVLAPTLAYGGPTNGVVTAGQATIATRDATTTITQSSSRAIIQWKDFSVGTGELTRFVQPDASSAVLNRVTGGNPTQILGRLEANGAVFVINPNGVLVGRDGVIATGGTFAASTRGLGDAAFLRGDRDLAFSGTSAAGIANLGVITSASGDAILVGRTVRNAGTIDAPRGTAVLAAGDEVLLQRQSDDTLRVRFTAPEGNPAASGATGVDHSGIVRAAQAELAASGGDLYALAVKASGSVQATGIEERGGRIFLTAERGGSIEATGEMRATRSGTGSAAVGGDVAVLADGHTKFSGKIETGQGGFAEVSGRGTLDFTGLVDTRGGRLLLDPTDFTIDNAQLGTISAQLANQAVTIYASGNIFYTANGSATVGLFPVTGRGYNLTFNADDGINFAAGSRLNLTGAAADLQLYANTGDIVLGNGALISMTGGQALLRASRDITLGVGASVTFGSGGRFLAVADSSAITGTGPFTSVPQDRVGRLTLGSGATLNAATVQLFAVKPSDFVNTSSYTPGAPTYNTPDSAVTLSTAGSGLWFQSNSSGTFGGGGTSNLTVKADNLSKTYGDALPTFTASYTGLINGDTSSVVTGLQFSTTATLGSNVGTYAITPFGASAPPTYTLAYVNGTLTVNRAPLIVQAPDASVFYRDTLGNRPVTVSGLKNGDQALGVIDRVFGAVSTPADANSVPGTYPITANVNLTSPNYTLSVAPGTLTIKPAPLTLQVYSFDRAYGDANPTLTATLLGAKGPDSPSSLVSYSLATTASQSSNVGIFPIAATASLLSSNYSLTVQPGTATVMPAVLTLRPPDARKTYGDPLPNLAAPLVTGLKNGDTAAAVVNAGNSVTTATALDATAGAYAINSTGALLSSNYALSLQPGTLTVDRAPLTIRAADAARQPGEPNPAFTATYTGFKLGETTSVLGNVGISTTATQSSPAGLYPITPTATSPNYAITFIPGTLSLGDGFARQLTLQAADATRYYAQPNPEWSLLPPVGLAAGDSVTSVKFATTATLGSNVGTYTITPFGAVLARPSGTDYGINYVPGTLTINPQVLRLQLNPFLASDYGDPLASPFFALTSPTAKNIPATGFGLNGIRNGDAVALDGVSVQLSGFGLGLPEGRLNAGVYRTGGALGSLLTNGVANPNVRLELGNTVPYEVRRREFSLTPAKHTTTYGNEVTQNSMPFTTQGALPGSVGLLPGDTLADVFSSFVFTGLPSRFDPVGYYEIRTGGTERVNSNYRFTGATSFGSVAVVAAPLKVSVAPVHYTYGQPVPFSYTLSGFLRDEDRTPVTGSLSYTVSYYLDALELGIGNLKTNSNYFVDFPRSVPAQVDPVTFKVSGSPVAAIIGGTVPRPTLAFDGFVAGDSPLTLRLRPFFDPSSFVFTPRYTNGYGPGDHFLDISNVLGNNLPGYRFLFEPAPFLLQQIIPATVNFEGDVNGFTKINVTDAKLVGAGQIGQIYRPEYFGIPVSLASQYWAIIDHYHKTNGLTWNGDVEGWLRVNGGNVELIARMTGSVAAVLADLAQPGRALTNDQRMLLVYMQEKIRSEKMAATASAYNDYLAWKIDNERITDTQGPNLLTVINYGWDKVPPESYMQRAQSAFEIDPGTFFTWATMMAQLGKPEILANAMIAAIHDAESKGESAAAVIASLSAGIGASGMTAATFNSIMPFVAESAVRTAQEAFLAASTARTAAQAAQAAAQAAAAQTTWAPLAVTQTGVIVGDVSNLTRTAISTAITPLVDAGDAATTGLNAAKAAITGAAVSSIAVGVITTVASVILNKALDDVVKITMTENEMGASVLRAAQTPNLGDLANDGSLLLYLAKFSSQQVELRQRYAEAVIATTTTAQTNPLITLPTP